MQQKKPHARAHTQHTHKSVSPSCLAPTATRKPRVRSRQQHLVSGQWPSQSPGSSRHVPQTRSTPCSDGASLLLARVSIRVPWGENRRHVFDPHAPSTRASDCMFEVRVACQRHHLHATVSQAFSSLHLGSVAFALRRHAPFRRSTYESRPPDHIARMHPRTHASTLERSRAHVHEHRA